MSAEARRCETCRHAHPVALGPGVIECRERPPAVMWTHNGPAAAFPQLAKAASCGRWQHRGVDLAAGIAAAIPAKGPA